MIGKTISHYRITEKLGEGGMGIVYKAFDTKLERDVAIKILRPEAIGDPAARERFIREARAASSLNHPNVTTIYEINEWHGQDFICMEYVAGETVKEKILKGQIPIEEVLDIALKVAEALKEAHEYHVIHRDIKSENIMITPKGQVKVMDFGLAKIEGTATNTQVGTTMGTIAYMSPEQTRGESVDHRTDIWSFGVVLYELLTGQLPFKGDYEQAVIYSILNEVPKPITGLRSGVPLEVEQIIDKALQKNQQDRFQSAKDLSIDLIRLKQYPHIMSDQINEDMPGLQSTKGRYKKRIKIHKKFLFIAVGAIALFMLVFILILSQGIKKQDLAPGKINANSIAVMYFNNHTNEPNLEKIFVDMLTTNLSRYEELEVVSSQRLFDILKIIGRNEINNLDEHVATEVAIHAQVKTMLLGSIIQIGNKIRVNAQLCDVKAGNNIGSEQVEGSRLEDIFGMADQLTEKIRDKLGISASNVRGQKLKIADVTTGSYQSYEYFIRGREAYEKYYLDDARQFLEKAVAHDSTFAVAYLYLARTYDRLRNKSARTDAFKKAKRFSLKTTEKERLYIEVFYARIIEGNSEKQFQILKEMVKKYPHEKRVYHYLANYYSYNKRLFSEAITHYNKALTLDPLFYAAIEGLAYTYAKMENFKKALEVIEQYTSNLPRDATLLESIADLYFRMGKLDDAILKYKEALNIKPDFGAEWAISYLYALKEDYPATMMWLDRYIVAAPSKDIKAYGYWWKAFYHYWLGNWTQTLHNLQMTTEMAEAADNDFWVAGVEWMKGWTCYDRGEYDLSQNHFRVWTDYAVEMIPDQAATYQAWSLFLQGLIDVKQGRIQSVHSRLADIKALLPKLGPFDKIMIMNYHDFIFVELLLAENYHQRAIEVAEKSPNWEIPTMNPGGRICNYNFPCIRDILARSYDQAGDLDRAIAEYERLITFDPDSKDRRLINPQYHYRLAKLYEEQGKSGKAINEYRTFLELWKNADADMPQLMDARARYAKLTNDK